MCFHFEVLYVHGLGLAPKNQSSQATVRQPQQPQQRQQQHQQLATATSAAATSNGSWQLGS